MLAQVDRLLASILAGKMANFARREMLLAWGTGYTAIRDLVSLANKTRPIRRDGRISM